MKIEECTNPAALQGLREITTSCQMDLVKKISRGGVEYEDKDKDLALLNGYISINERIGIRAIELLKEYL